MRMLGLSTARQLVEPIFTAGLCAGLAALPVTARAERPLATEVADTIPAGHCQLEGWADHNNGAHEGHFAPACGLVPGFEMAAEWAGSMPSRSDVQNRLLGFKWGPEWLEWEGARFGIKGLRVQERTPSADDTSWHNHGTVLMGITSVPLDPNWTVHAHLGRNFMHNGEKDAMVYGVGLVWTPTDHWMLFAEVVGDHLHTATQTVGVRYWILPDKLGVDLTQTHSNATPGSSRTGFGIGWYLIHF